MKGKIKLLSLLMALAMVASMFVACDGNETKDPSSKPADGDDKPTETVELTWWHWGDPPKNGDAAIKALNEQSKKDINVTVNFKWATTDDSKLKTMLSSGEKADLTFCCSWFGNYLVSAQEGFLYDITDLVAKETALKDFVPEWGWDAVTVNDKIYGVPTMKDSAAQQFWLVNKEYVLDGAKAEEEFKATGARVSSVTPLLRKVKAYADAGNAYPNGLTAAFNYNKAGLNGYETGWDIIQSDLHIGDKIDEKGIKIVSAYEDPDMIADYKELATWYKEGLVNKDCAQTEKEPEFIVVGTAQGWEGAELSAWGVGKPYTVSINSKYGPVTTRPTVLGSVNSVFKNAPHPAEAVKYLAYINTNETYRNMLAYGEPDVNWKDNGDGTVTSLNTDFQPGSFSQAATWIMKPVAPAPATMYKDIQKMCENAEPSELISFAFDQSSVEDEIAACAAIIKKYAEGLQCGTYADVDATLAAMIKELEAAGYRKVIEEAQTQVDAYLG